MSNPDQKQAYWLVSGRIPYDDDDTLYATLTRCTKAEATEQFAGAMICEALDSKSEEQLRRSVFDNITESQPLTEGVIVTGYAFSDSRIEIDGYLL